MSLARLAVVLAALSLFGGAARAETEEERERARKFFKAGKELYELGQYEEARKQFQAGYDIVPTPLFLFNLGQCLRAVGDRRGALDYYRRFVAVAKDSRERQLAIEFIGDLEKGLLFQGGGGRTAPADLTALARQEFDLAEKELNLGHFEKSLEHFEACYRLTSKPQLLYNLGYVNRQLFERSRKLAFLEQAIERFKGFLSNTNGSTDPKVVAQRPRAETDLKSAEDAYAREQAKRAKGEEALALGEEFVKQGRVGEARVQLDRYEKAPNNERAGLARAFVLRAAIAIADGKPALARDAFAAALELDKSIVLPIDAPEASRSAFAEAERLLGAVPALAVTHNAPGSLKPGLPVVLSFTSTPDPMKLVRSIELRYRAGSGAWSTLSVQPGPVKLPPAFSSGLLPGAKIEYYGELVDPNGAVLQHLGTEALPFQVEVERPVQSVVKKWWFWTAAVAVVAVAAGAIGLTAYYTNPPPIEIPFQALRAR
jgi:tetratricopeptide (TPR) repeat protein